MEAKLVAVLVLTLVLMLAPGAWCDSHRRTIRLDLNGTEPYRDTPFYAHIGEVLDIDCLHMQKLSLFSVTEEDYDNCTLPVSVVDGGTSVFIGDCPQVITLILATNIISNLVNYKVGGTYYYAAYGVNDTTYQDYNSDLCMEGVKFTIHIEDKDDEEQSVSPSSTVVPSTSQTTVSMDTSSVTISATPTPTISTQPTTSTTEPTISTTTEGTERTEPDRVTVPTATRPSVEEVNLVIAEGVADSAFSHRPYPSLLTTLVLFSVILTHITRWL